LHKTTEQIIDTISPDVVIEAGFSAEAMEKAKGLITSFEQFNKIPRRKQRGIEILI
jgi:type I restriction enzyme R subunit